MKADVLEALQEMVSRLEARFPAAVTTLEPVGPNGLTLAVVLGDHLVELDWYAGEGFGVTRVTEDKSFTRGSDAAFASAADAERYLFQQLAMIAGLYQEDSTTRTGCRGAMNRALLLLRLERRVLIGVSILGCFAARQLLAMPEAERDRILSEAAAHAALLYEADLALPPERRELTALSAIEDDIHDYHREGVAGKVPRMKTSD